ncbi:MAG: hypothetical protein ACRDHZ_01340 [Ktedonobacteraceae bacterium]
MSRSDMPCGFDDDFVRCIWEAAVNGQDVVIRGGPFFTGKTVILRQTVIMDTGGTVRCVTIQRTLDPPDHLAVANAMLSLMSA